MQQDNSEKQLKVDILLNSEFLTTPTREALQERRDKVGQNQFFDELQFTLLNTVCDVLTDQDSENRMVNIALYIDERLDKKESDGWRYNTMPSDDLMYIHGLKGIDQTSNLLFQDNFCQLDKEKQSNILYSIQRGNPVGKTWQDLNAKLFFEELLSETAEIFFSHPSVQMSIDYVGMADAKGWTKIKLNQSENLEADSDLSE